MRSNTIAGVALILVGFLFLSGLFSLAVTPQFYWSESYPNGSQATPVYISLNQPIEIYTSTISNSLPDPSYWNVTVTITWSGKYNGTQTIDLGQPKEKSTEIYYEEGVKTKYTLAKWSVVWTPAYDGVTYQFKWKVVAKDASGSITSTYFKTTYAKTLDINEPTPIPDGIFKFNNQDVIGHVELSTTSPSMKFQFSPTKNVEYIKSIYVEIQNRTTGKTEKVSFLNSVEGYVAYYTLLDQGYYSLKFCIEPVEGSVIIKNTMTLTYFMPDVTPTPPPVEPTTGPGTTPTPTPTPTTGSFFTINRVIGIAIIGLGAIIIVSRRD